MAAVAAVAADGGLEAVRERSFNIAYRMLGSVTEADDVAQEATLRFARADTPIAEPLAWITTVATRLSIDVLRLARRRREAYVGPWLAEPLIDEHASDAGTHAELADSVSQAFLVVLERLTPVARAAFLLREAFDYDYARIAEVIDRSEANARQLVVRAKKHVDANRTRFDTDERLREKLLERFMAAAEAGDLEALEDLLAEDAAVYSDGGGKASAARKPIFGGARLARLFVGLARKMRGRGAFMDERVHIGAQPARIRRTPDGAASPSFPSTSSTARSRRSGSCVTRTSFDTCHARLRRQPPDDRDHAAVVASVGHRPSVMSRRARGCRGEWRGWR